MILSTVYTNVQFWIFAVCTAVMLIMTGSLYWLSFVSTTQRERGGHRCSYVGLVPERRNVRMFLEYLNYVVHFLQIDQERKTQKIAHKQKQDNQRSMQLRYNFLITSGIYTLRGILAQKRRVATSLADFLNSLLTPGALSRRALTGIPHFLVQC